MRKVIIRRKEVLNHLPKEIRAGAKIKIGSIYIGRQPLKGLEGEEAHKLLSKVLDVPPGHQDWPRKEKEFWASMSLKVPFEGVELDVSTDEDGFPNNVMDFITYKWCLKHRQVADNEDSMNSDGSKKFYIYDPEIDLLKRSANIKVRKEADKEMIKLEKDYAKMRRLMRVLSKDSRPDSLTDMEVENQLFHRLWKKLGCAGCALPPFPLPFPPGVGVGVGVVVPPVLPPLPVAPSSLVLLPPPGGGGSSPFPIPLLP